MKSHILILREMKILNQIWKFLLINLSKYYMVENTMQENCDQENAQAAAFSMLL